ncbi:MAG: hypothetical protein LBR77_03620 [Lachnospiraceae bacterium]|jgi:hypothetical protein|nr:hypothetical protein [Lachnospiraceae bacterium]
MTGIYPLLKGDDTLTGTVLCAVIFDDERRECTTWARLLSVVGEFLYCENPLLFTEAASDSVWYNQNNTIFRRPIPIADTAWFCCGGGYDGKSFRNAAASVAEKMGCLERFKLEVTSLSESG